MASEQHSEIKQFMQRAASGKSTEGRELRFDTRTGKFVVATDHDSIADDVPQITAEDLRSFQNLPLHQGTAHRGTAGQGALRQGTDVG